MKPKILFILHVPPPIHGAAMVGQFIRESKVINNSFDATYVNLSTSTKMNEIGKGGIAKFAGTFKIMRKVVKSLMSRNYDLCYMTLTANGYGYYKDVVIVTLLKIFGKKIIYHFHNKGVSIRQNKLLDNLLYRFTFKATKSILLSSLLYYDIAAFVPKKDVFVCANGIPELENRTAVEQSVKKTDNVCKILFLSNMVIAKGVLVLLEACKLLREKGLTFECHFVGDWTDISENRFNELVMEKGLSNYIFPHGKKYNEEKLVFYRSSDIFVLPTFKECFPLVLLEAMQFGLPIISTNEGGIAEIVSDGITGFILPQNNAVELAGKLEALIEDGELRNQMGVAGRKRFEEKFTLNHFENRLSEILFEGLKS